VIPLEILVALAAGTDTIALAGRADLRHDPSPSVHRDRCPAGRRVRRVPGGHLAPMELPVPFAAGLRGVFGRL
jgi:hypothetical protein